MTYEQALAYWFAHINYELRTPTPDDLKLERMRVLLAGLDNPHHPLRILHVAGSKGKGSTSAMLASVLHQAGFHTGLFTSPHLVHLEERFQINGQLIAKDELAALLTEIRTVVESTDMEPTYFELATALGFLYFCRHQVEAVILEVGLGGRLDSTNVCDPILSIITSISYDHTRILGEKLCQIAREKAGIIKPGRPVISGVRNPEAREVIEEVAHAQNAPLLQIDRDFHYRYRPGFLKDRSLHKPVVEVVTTTRHWPTLSLNLLGAHQAANASLVVSSVETLRSHGWKIPDEAVVAGLDRVHWPARMEWLGGTPTIILDCAHNVASAEALIDTLLSSFPPMKRSLLFASSSDKDAPGMFRILAPHFSRAMMTRYTNNPRAMTPEHLATLWQQFSDAPVECKDNPEEALAHLWVHTGPEELLCITGSVFLAGQLRPHLLLSRKT